MAHEIDFSDQKGKRAEPNAVSLIAQKAGNCHHFGVKTKLTTREASDFWHSAC